MTNQKTIKASESNTVNTYMQNLGHPRSDVVEVLRQIILETSPTIGEEVKWNAPTFFYTGAMKPFNPKEYKRYLVVFNLFKKDCIRLVFWGGAKVHDTSGLLEGDYKDGRRLALFFDLADVAAKKPLLQRIVREQVRLLQLEQGDAAV
jgi:hypothetical protein